MKGNEIKPGLYRASSGRLIRVIYKHTNRWYTDNGVGGGVEYMSPLQLARLNIERVEGAPVGAGLVPQAATEEAMLRLHATNAWLANDPDGSQADFERAWLSGYAARKAEESMRVSA